MMNIRSYIKTYNYDNGDLQRVQVASFDKWEDLRFIRPKSPQRAFDDLCRLYTDFFMDQVKPIVGHLIMFRLPDDMDVPFPMENKKYGKICDRLAAVAVAFRKNIYGDSRGIHFRNSETEDFYNRLKEAGCLKTAKGKWNHITLMPVGNELGYLSDMALDYKLLVNSNFFVFMHMECVSVYDRVGMPIGLCIDNGRIINPPMFRREALMVYEDGLTQIEYPDIRDIEIEAAGTIYKHGKNACIYMRPETKRTPSGGTDIVVVENRVVAIKEKGGVTIPAGGYVIKTDKVPEGFLQAEKNVRYHGFEHVKFAIQVGNSAVIDGKPVYEFRSVFHKLLKLWKPLYPPATYPLGYDTDRAPRIALGADAGGGPVLIWFEGAGKFGYKPGEDSCGATLKEVADICCKEGLVNAVNLDGGGSAQIILNGNRQLKISDRDKGSLEETERPIPMGLCI